MKSFRETFGKYARRAAGVAAFIGLGGIAQAQSPSAGGSHMGAVHEVQMSATPLRVDPDRPWAEDLDYLKAVDRVYFKSAQRILDIYVGADVGAALSNALLAKDIETGIRTRTAPGEEYRFNTTNMGTYILPDLLGAQSVPHASNNLRVVMLDGNAQRKLLIEMKRLNDALYRVENRFEKKHDRMLEKSAEAAGAADEALKSTRQDTTDQAQAKTPVDSPVDSMAVYNVMAARLAAETPAAVAVPEETAGAQKNTAANEESSTAVVYDAMTAAKLRATYEAGVLRAIQTGKEQPSLNAAAMETYGDAVVYQEPSESFIKKARTAYENAQLSAVRSGKDVSPVSTAYAEQFGVSENSQAFKDGRLAQACAEATARAARLGREVPAVVSGYQRAP